MSVEGEQACHNDQQLYSSRARAVRGHISASRCLWRRKVASAVNGLRSGPRSVRHILDSERIRSAAAANSGTSATSGNTVTSTCFTASADPSRGRDEASDGTWSVTETTRHNVLGRVFSTDWSTG